MRSSLEALTIILARRGMTIEAGTMALSIYETGFWIGYLHKDAPRAVEDFWTEELKGQKGRQDQFAKVYADEAEKASGHRAEVDALKAAMVGRKKPTIEEVAGTLAIRSTTHSTKAYAGSPRRRHHPRDV